VPRIEGDTGTQQQRPRDVFMLMINGAKERAPTAAVEVLKRLAPDFDESAARHLDLETGY
jgi:hypothetical protein